VGRPYIGGYPASIELPFIHHHHVTRTYAVLRHLQHRSSLCSLFACKLQLVRPLCLSAAARPPSALAVAAASERRIPLVPSAPAQLHHNTPQQPYPPRPQATVAPLPPRSTPI